MKVQTTKVFLRRLKELLKNYPSVISDIAPLVASLKQGHEVGDRVTGVKGKLVFKVRVANSDAQKGKRGGYRVLYYLVDQERTLLLTMYSKSHQDNISASELLDIMNEWLEEEN